LLYFAFKSSGARVSLRRTLETRAIREFVLSSSLHDPYTILYRFVTVTVLSTKHQTPVVKKNLNPEYAPKDATFDFPLYLSVAEKLGAVELVVWDKDMLKKEYLGEASLLLTDWFPSHAGFGFADAENKVRHSAVVHTKRTH
jgi:hypothetical protein